MMICLSCGAEWDDAQDVCPMDGKPLIPSPEEQSRLGPYVLLGQLGGGGMARVYKARSPQGEEVALKVLFSSRESKDSVTRFTREWQILASIVHPNIVKVLDAGETEDGAHYLAMELLHGEDLSARIKRAGPLSLEESLHLAQQILDALETVHSAGIVHRDLKPSNIWLCSGDYFQSKLIDFGIARPLDATSRLTAVGKIVGTPAYLAPEQLRGDELLDNRADVYSFGVTLYEALTGHLPIEAPDAISLMVRVASEPPTSPKTYRPDLPKEVVAALLRALEKDPERRFLSASEFAQALESPRSTTRTPSVEVPAFPESIEQSEQSAIIVVVERVGAKAPSGFVGRAVESLRSKGGLAELLGAGRVAAIFGVNARPNEPIGTYARHAISSALSLRHPSVRIAISTDPMAAAAGHDLGGVRATHLVADTNPGEIRVDPETFAQIQSWVDADAMPDGSFVIRSIRRGQSQSRQVLGIETPTIGRETEIARLRAAIAGTNRARRPRGMLFLGEEGVGKSRLLREAKDLAEQLVQGALILFGAAEPQRQGEPFGLFAHLLSSVAAPPLQLPPEEGALLSPLDTGLRRSRSSIEDALFAWLANLSAERLVMLILEDLHVADQESLQVLSRVLSSGTGPVMVLATARPELLASPDGASLSTKFSRLDLLPLEIGQVVSLLQAILGAPPDDFLLERVYEVSLGNPMILEELLRVLVDMEVLQQGANGAWQLVGDLSLCPTTLPRILTTRMSSLPPESQTVLQRASVFGKSFPIDVLPALGVLKPGPLLELLQSREFIVSEIWEELPSYRFRYIASQQAWYSALPPESVAALHRNVGRWLKENNKGEPSLFAWHAQLGERPRKAARYLHELGIISFLRGAEETALAHLEHALTSTDVEVDQFEILSDREEILFQMGNYQAAWPDVKTMLHLAESLGDEPRRGRALLCEGRLWADADPTRAQPALSEALEILTTSKDDLGIASCHFFLSIVLRHLGDMEQSLRFAKAAHRMTQDLGRRGLELDVVGHLAALSRDLGDYARAIRAAERGLALARRSGDKAKEASITAILGDLASRIGRYEEAEAHLREALALSPRAATPSTHALRASLVKALLALGRVDAAIAAAEEPRKSTREEPAEGTAELEVCTAEALWARGAPGDNSRGVNFVENALQRAPTSLVALQGRLLLARFRLSRRDIDTAFYELEQAEVLRQTLGAISPHEEHLAYVWSLALRAAGREEEAQRSLQNAQTLIQANAERISDEEMRRSYLEMVPLCREVMGVEALPL